jgi:hypothetical protein
LNDNPESFEFKNTLTESVGIIYLEIRHEAVELLRQNVDKIWWVRLSGNTSIAAVELMKYNLYRIDWRMLSGNTCCSAVDLLRENPDKIDWYILSGNT